MFLSPFRVIVLIQWLDIVWHKWLKLGSVQFRIMPYLLIRTLTAVPYARNNEGLNA
jgi:hypothetical protein